MHWSESALKKALQAQLDADARVRLRTACQDGELFERVLPRRVRELEEPHAVHLGPGDAVREAVQRETRSPARSVLARDPGEGTQASGHGGAIECLG